MKVLDLFCGTKSVANAFAARGHEVYTVDWDKRFEPSLAADIGTLTAADIINLCGGVPDVIWASPDCTTYSVCKIGYHRRREENGNLAPVTDYAKKCDEINKHLVDLIRELKPTYWFIENPVAGLRKMDFMQELPRYTVTYCQYGDRRMKPTDIWTNHPDPQFKPPCRQGSPCHEAAPRGSQTGTQGLKNKIERARIPEALCQHIVDICEKGHIDDDGKILIDGKFTSIYLCDRKDKCNKSNYCGKECRYTFKEEHREPQLSMFN